MSWTPARVVFLVSRFAARCYWCGFAVPRGASVAFYPDERETAHDRCHREACT